MKTQGMFTAAQAKYLSPTEYAHYLGCGCIDVTDTAQLERMLEVERRETNKQIAELQDDNADLARDLEAANSQLDVAEHEGYHVRP